MVPKKRIRMDKQISKEQQKKIQLDVLKNIDEFCKENNIKYSLAFGTLLGAVRHQGYIPWDDDIDIMMPRKDYKRLLSLYKQGKKIKGIELLYSTYTNEYYYPFAKLCDTNTIAKMQSSVTKHGIWIDVFPIDKVPSDTTKTVLFQKRMILLRAAIISFATDFKHRKFDIKTIPKLFLSICVKVIGGKRMTLIMEKEARKYNNSTSDRYCPVIWQAATGGILTKEELKNRIKIPFEQYEFYAIKNYDSYLKSLYGNYMVLPPENKRITHGLEVYYISEEDENNA